MTVRLLQTACLAVILSLGCNGIGVSDTDAGVAGDPGPPTVRQGVIQCPVCAKNVDIDASTTYIFRGSTHYFCSEKCVRDFKRNPERYPDRPAPDRSG